MSPAQARSYLESIGYIPGESSTAELAGPVNPDLQRREKIKRACLILKRSGESVDRDKALAARAKSGQAGS